MEYTRKEIEQTRQSYCAQCEKECGEAKPDCESCDGVIAEEDCQHCGAKDSWLWFANGGGCCPKCGAEKERRMIMAKIETRTIGEYERLVCEACGRDGFIVLIDETGELKFECEHCGQWNEIEN